MIMFLLLDVVPAMCHPDCKTPYSSRVIWIEIDGQILNALFCITAFGLAPRRVRDFYYLLRWRYIKRDKKFHRKLAGLYRGWYRLPGSDKLPEYLGPPQSYKRIDISNSGMITPYSKDEIIKLESNEAIPLPISLMPAPPLTGVRSAPSRSCCLDIFIGMSLLNTLLQIIYASMVWSTTRFQRSEIRLMTVSLVLITTGCLTAFATVFVAHRQSKRVRNIEGVPLQDYDVVESVEDFQKRQARSRKRENMINQFRVWLAHGIHGLSQLGIGSKKRWLRK